MISLPDPRTLFTGLMASAVMCHHIRRATARSWVQRRTLEKYVYLNIFGYQMYRSITSWILCKRNIFSYQLLKEYFQFYQILKNIFHLNQIFLKYRMLVKQRCYPYVGWCWVLTLWLSPEVWQCGSSSWHQHKTPEPEPVITRYQPYQSPLCLCRTCAEAIRAANRTSRNFAVP